MDELRQGGTVGHIIQLLRFPKGPVKVLVEGRARALPCVDDAGPGCL